MGASVGVGGLIIGISMLVVFSMAVTTLNSQMATSLEAIESAHTPEPILTIDNARYLDAIEAIALDPLAGTGTGYVDGTLISSDCPGFSVPFTVDGDGKIISLDSIVNRGICSADPASIQVKDQTGDGNAVFSSTVSPYLHANITNSGSETLSTNEAWIFFDGSSPTTINSGDSQFNPSISASNWFSGETISLISADQGTPYTRLSLTVGETSVSRIIVTE